MTKRTASTWSPQTVLQQPTPPAQDGENFEFNGFESEGTPEKDQTEIELEKLVFGDAAGFQKNLRDHQFDVETEEGEEQYGSDQDSDIPLNDADVFTLDAAPSSVPASSIVHSVPRHDSTEGGNAPLWIDSDDERLVVSLASNPRLRKLRLTETEDLVNGKEYINRLRQQYLRLHPTPAWAKQDAHSHSYRKKRRRRSDSSDGLNASDSDSASDDSHVSVSSSSRSTKPLASFLQNTSGLLRASSNPHDYPNKKRRISPSTITVQRLKDVGSTQPSLISSLEFHPTHPLLLSSGPSALISLHHISPSPSTPNPNPLVTSLHLKGVPLTTATFLHPSGNKIYCSGRRRYFHIWDLPSGKIEKVSHSLGTGPKKEAANMRSLESFKLSPCGRYMGVIGTGKRGGGSIEILDARTCQWIASVRVEGRGGVADFAWWGNGEGLAAIGKGGEAVEWDGRKKEVVARWIDEGAVGTTVIALSGDHSRTRARPSSITTSPLGPDRFLAVGSSTGITNIYDRHSWLPLPPHNPTPQRALSQLTTSITHLSFSPDGQILCMASRAKRDALRLVHLPSCGVYAKWPNSGTPLGRVSAIAWGRGGLGGEAVGLLAVGNEQGRIRLWEVSP